MTREASERTIRWASDHGLLVSFGNDIELAAHRRVVALVRALREAKLTGLRDLHPGYCSLLVTFDPLLLDPELAEEEVGRIADRETPLVEAADRERVVEIPVCYDEEFGPDLAEIARVQGLSPAEVARLHAAAEYRVYFLGFAPGFPYLGGLPEALATPRLSAPRRRVPAGSVAIAGRQAGIYPFTTPGGWRILGRTPLRLFRSDLPRPALLTAGDRVRFVPIDAGEFRARLED